jgi:hypothetical protein
MRGILNKKEAVLHGKPQICQVERSETSRF